MKKLICLLLAMQLLLTAAVPVLAEDTVTDPVGEPNGETTAAQTCEHSWMEGSVVEPSCTENGELVSVCTLCNETKTQVLEKLGHSFTILIKKDASGHTAVCDRCGAEEAQSHTWGQSTVTKKPTCTEAGEKVSSCQCGEIATETVEAAGHSYSDWTKIGKEDVDAKVADKKHRRVCSGCELVEYEDHKWKEEVITKATCKEAGKIRKTCTECGYVVEEVTPKLKDHVYDNDCDADCNSCGETRKVSHNYGNSWSRDSTGHWYECTKCGEKKDYKAHTAGPAPTEERDQVCTICDYVIKKRLEHKHDYDTTWSTDKTGHWHACKTCDDEKDFAKHTYDNECDDTCNVCDYVNLNAHKFGEEWKTNEKRHWKECTLCGEKQEEEKHIPGPEATDETAQLCTVCGFELAPIQEHTHDFSSPWYKDETNHWKICDCAEQSVPAPHTWDEGEKNGRNSVVFTCTQCGYERMEITEGGSWWIPVLIVILVLALGAAAVILFVLPKFQSGKFSTPKGE